jgi:hypothetical protein
VRPKERKSRVFFRERSEEKQTETLEIRGEKRKGRETERGDSFLKEKGKPSKETEERKGSDREKNIYQRRRATATATVLPLHRHSTPPDRR